MHIAIDARLYGTEHRGLGRYVERLIAGLAGIDTVNSYTLLVNPSNKDAPRGLPSNFRLCEAPWRVYSFWGEQLQLSRLLDQLKPDLVHFPHFAVPVRTRRPFVVTVHDLILHHRASERAITQPGILYGAKVLAYRWVIRRAIFGARTILVPSESVANDIRGYYPRVADRLKVVPLGVTVASPAPVAAPARYFLTVGAAYPHKNLELLPKVVSQLPPDIVIVSVGRMDAFRDRLKTLVEEEGLARRIIFWGEASEAELAGLYHGALGYLIPSFEEGFGLGAVEALHYGTPVIASDIPVHREVLGEAAMFVGPADTNGWVGALVEVANLSEEAKSRVVRKARERVSKYSWEGMARDTLAIYQLSR